MAKQVSINEDGASFAIRAAVGNAPDNQRKSILERYYPKVYTAQDLQKANQLVKNKLYNIQDKTTYA